jgi:hypothetical protein
MRQDVIKIVAYKTLKRRGVRQKDAIKRWGHGASPSCEQAL